MVTSATAASDHFTAIAATAASEMSESVVKPVKATFEPVDYVVFSVLLMVSAAVGIYFAVQEHRNKSKCEETTTDYLMAGRSMSYGPVSMSLIASFMSSVTILGVPAEYYVYGTMFSWFALPYALLPIIIGWVFMPVFYDLQLSSTYEYLRLRFNNPTKILAIILYMIVSVLYGGVVVYGPSIALSEVTGFNEWTAILTTGLVCIFYTSLGGLKAVIWTDVIQTVVMLSGFFAVIIQGSINLGGFGNIWRAAEEGGRIDFVHFEADPRIRHTFWSIVLGGTVFWMSVNGLNQAQVQRYVCCKTKKQAKIAIILNSIGLIVILVLAGMTGLTIYATYQHCDPLTTGQINKPDQLFPFIVMDILSYIPGIPGLFVAGVYSSSLSTISSGINAMATVTLEDFVRPNTRWSESSYKKFSQLLVVFFGLMYILFAYLASVVGGLIKMAYSVLGIIGGALAGLFVMGVLMPCINSWGAFIGTVCGFGVCVVKFVGSQLYPIPVEFLNKMPMSVEECPVYIESVSNSSVALNYTAATAATPMYVTTFANGTDSLPSSNLVNFTTESYAETERPPMTYFYDISYMYTAPMGLIVSVVVGLLVSCLTAKLTKSTSNTPRFQP